VTSVSNARIDAGGDTLPCSAVAHLPCGSEVLEFRLANHAGMQANVLTLGATLRSLIVPDAHGRPGDVVLGFAAAADYLRSNDCFGATVGRYANRIAAGSFSLAGRSYQLACNSPPNAEHGGPEGFHRRVWRVERAARGTAGAVLEMSLLSPDGDQGYPGELQVRVTYTLTDANELRIDYGARSGATTVVNLTHHSYWNLAAAGGALQALLTIDADAYTPVDEHLIPTGELRPVAGTAFDFRTPRRIDAAIRDSSEPQLRIAGGYDHNFVLRGPVGTLRHAARLEEPRSGRVLELWTTEPGLQLYSGNFLSGAIPGKGGRRYQPGDGVALEPQHFPDSPNQPQFPSTVLEPGRDWSSTTLFRFSNTPLTPPAGGTDGQVDCT
jgi:aldose 1-epimerase